LRAWRPEASIVSKVASPPYDIVTRDEAAARAAGNPFSFLHVVRSDIDLPPATDPHAPEVYARANRNWQSLIRDCFAQEAEPSVYLYELTLQGHAQLGVVGCLHVDDYEHGVIRKHENTRQDKEDDRTRHILTLNAHAEPVLLAHEPSTFLAQLNSKVTHTTPLFDYTADGVRHRGWRAGETRHYVDAIRRIHAAYIADGHHRTAGAWRAAQERKQANPKHTGDEEYNWFLAVLFPANQLRILPYHRAVRDLNGMTAEGFASRLMQRAELVATDQPIPTAPGSYGVRLGEQWFRLTLPRDSINPDDVLGSHDAVLLQNRVLEPLLGIRDIRSDPRVAFVGGLDGIARLEKLVRSGEMATAFAMRPATMDEIVRVSDAGQIMPPKSTWFEPKLHSGLFVHTL
jgi:uncharacterized protein (DUF1015 family)